MEKIFLYLVMCTAVFDCSSHTFEDDFVDPFDMLNYDLATSKYKKPQEPPQEEKPQVVAPTKEQLQEVDQDGLSRQPTKEPDKDSNAPPTVGIGQCNKQTQTSECLGNLYMVQYVKSLMTKLQMDSVPYDIPVTYRITITFDKDDVAVLKRFAYEDDGSIQDVSDVLDKMEGHVGDAYEESFWSIDSVFGVKITFITQILSVVALVFSIIWMIVNLKLSFKQHLFYVIIVCFFMSIPWNWLHMYKRAATKKSVEVLKGIPDECKPSDTSWQGAFSSWWRATFSVMEDKCDKYHLALQVDPFWEVSPAEAVAASLSKFFLEPAGHIGAALSKFLQGLLLHVPVQWHVALFLTVAIISVLVLFMVFGYRLRLPFLASLEPAPRTGHPERLQQRISELEGLLAESQHKIAVYQTKRLEIENIGRTKQGLSETKPLPSLTSCRTPEQCSNDSSLITNVPVQAHDSFPYIQSTLEDQESSRNKEGGCGDGPVQLDNKKELSSSNDSEDGCKVTDKNPVTSVGATN